MTRYSSLTDAELVRACRAGDSDAWNELVERYSRYVYAIAVRGFRLSDDDAEDVFQDVFTRIYLRLDSLRDDSALRPWIAQLTRRRCLDAGGADIRVLARGPVAERPHDEAARAGEGRSAASAAGAARQPSPERVHRPRDEALLGLVGRRPVLCG